MNTQSTSASLHFKSQKYASESESGMLQTTGIKETDENCYGKAPISSKSYSTGGRDCLETAKNVSTAMIQKNIKCINVEACEQGDLVKQDNTLKTIAKQTLKNVPDIKTSDVDESYTISCCNASDSLLQFPFKEVDFELVTDSLDELKQIRMAECAINLKESAGIASETHQLETKCTESPDVAFTNGLQNKAEVNTRGDCSNSKKIFKGGSISSIRNCSNEIDIRCVNMRTASINMTKTTTKQRSPASQLNSLCTSTDVIKQKMDNDLMHSINEILENDTERNTLLKNANVIDAKRSLPSASKTAHDVDLSNVMNDVLNDECRPLKAMQRYCTKERVTKTQSSTNCDIEFSNMDNVTSDGQKVGRRTVEGQNDSASTGSYKVNPFDETILNGKELEKHQPSLFTAKKPVSIKDRISEILSDDKYIGDLAKDLDRVMPVKDSQKSKLCIRKNISAEDEMASVINDILSDEPTPKNLPEDNKDSRFAKTKEKDFLFTEKKPPIYRKVKTKNKQASTMGLSRPDKVAFSDRIRKDSVKEKDIVFTDKTNQAKGESLTGDVTNLSKNFMPAMHSAETHSQAKNVINDTENGSKEKNRRGKPLTSLHTKEKESCAIGNKRSKSNFLDDEELSDAINDILSDELSPPKTVKTKTFVKKDIQYITDSTRQKKCEHKKVNTSRVASLDSDLEEAISDILDDTISPVKTKSSDKIPVRRSPKHRSERKTRVNKSEDKEITEAILDILDDNFGKENSSRGKKKHLLNARNKDIYEELPNPDVDFSSKITHSISSEPASKKSFFNDDHLDSEIFNILEKDVSDQMEKQKCENEPTKQILQVTDDEAIDKQDTVKSQDYRNHTKQKKPNVVKRRIQKMKKTLGILKLNKKKATSSEKEHSEEYEYNASEVAEFNTSEVLFESRVKQPETQAVVKKQEKAKKSGKITKGLKGLVSLFKRKEKEQ